MRRDGNPFLYLAPAIVASMTPAVAGAQTPTALARQPLPGIFSSGQPEAGDWPALADAGIGVVIDLRPDDERPGRNERDEVQAAGMDYLQIPVAGVQDLTTQAASRLWQALQQAHTDGKQVLVHCASANRVGALLALAVAAHDGRSLEQALQLGREAGMTGAESHVRTLLQAGQR